VNRIEAVERSATIAARACSSVLGTLFGADGSFDGVQVDEEREAALGQLEFPCVAVEVSFTEGLTGENLFVLRPDQVRALAAAMMGLAEPTETGELTEIELSAASEAMNQMMGAVSTEMAQAIGVPTDIAPPRTQILQNAQDASAAGFPDPCYAGRFTLHAGPIEATIVQLVPEDFADTLVSVFSSGDAMQDVLAGRAPSAAVAAATDDMFGSVERTARIAAESAAQVLSTLIGGEASATLPTVEQDPDDPLGRLQYPLVTVEVSYVSGVNGANLFVLTPEQARQLATIMMGLEEPMSTGELTEIELSAVCEAMNQMMGAATNILADTLSMAIEVAPPTCVVMSSAEEARAAFGEPAFSTRFRLVSDRLTADVVQLVPLEFAEHLHRAFSAADLGRDAVGKPAPSVRPADHGPRDAAGLTLRAGGIMPSSLRSVKVRVSAELGRSRMPIGQVVNLPPGAVVSLDRGVNDPIDVLVNGRPFAEARLVLVDGEYAVQIVKIAPQLAAVA
jgi:flagellar motor switch protein FliN/FliY